METFSQVHKESLFKDLNLHDPVCRCVSLKTVPDCLTRDTVAIGTCEMVLRDVSETKNCKKMQQWFTFLKRSDNHSLL